MPYLIRYKIIKLIIKYLYFWEFNSAGDQDVFITKLDPQGNVIWVKLLEAPGPGMVWG